MATTQREDAHASEAANVGEAKKRSALDLNERANTNELLTEERLQQRQEAVSLKRKQAGPELEAPDENIGLESMRSDDADVPETVLEEGDD